MATDDLRSRWPRPGWPTTPTRRAATRSGSCSTGSRTPPAELADRFAGPLTFGTAGLRGRLRAGPNGMNLAVVTRAAAGLVGWLADQGGAGPAGDRVRRPARLPAVRRADRPGGHRGRPRGAGAAPARCPRRCSRTRCAKLDAVAGVMVTASHNPPQDNGYKVYLGAALGGPGGAGAQIVPPADAGIEAAIQAVGPLAEVPLGEPGTVLGEDMVQGYVDSAAAVVTAGPRDLRVAYTPLHGVGGEVLAAAFAAAGFAEPDVVAEQAEPDPEFPTVAFPNPEEPGAMDLLLALAARTGADLAIANDPDADRCAVAIPRRRRRLAAAARRRAGRAARRPPDPARHGGHVRHHDRVVHPAARACARPAGCRTRRP